METWPVGKLQLLIAETDVYIVKSKAELCHASFTVLYSFGDLLNASLVEKKSATSLFFPGDEVEGVYGVFLVPVSGRRTVEEVKSAQDGMLISNSIVPDIDDENGDRESGEVYIHHDSSCR